MTNRYLGGRILIEAIAPLFGGLVMIWVLWNVEMRFMPVVTDFKITHAVIDLTGYTAVGTVNRRRGCEVINLAVVRVRNNVPTVLLDSQSRDLFSADASPGTNSWGPITLPLKKADLLDSDEIQILGLHRCHALWLKQTEYMKASWATLKLLAEGAPVKPAGLESRTKYFIRVAPIADSQ